MTLYCIYKSSELHIKIRKICSLQYIMEQNEIHSSLVKGIGIHIYTTIYTTIDSFRQGNITVTDIY